MTRIKSKVAVPNARPRSPYSGFRSIDGTHPYRVAVPDGYVDYPVRARPGGRVFYFNFDLAREMGLLPRRHPDTLTPELQRAVLDAFALQIINEHDIEHRPGALAEALPQPRMATRYLQLQHPDKRGRTSGDGRSVWNGYFHAHGVTWDITSCGTGVTRLCPATAIEKRYFKTGDKNASYGSGLSDIDSGVSAAIMSDIFHRNKIPTERTLAVIAYDDNTAITVRAGKNLLRPAHLFAWLKQGDYAALKGAVDYYIARQVGNGDWVHVATETTRYRVMLQHLAEAFAHAAALYEREYIFCWMEWDGDNILMDGAIIDYGSVRQFGLYHHQYRYDDVDRYSTSITEQRNKARYIIQTFAQMIDFLIAGKKKDLRQFRHHQILTHFDRVYARVWNDVLLYKLGYWREARERMLADADAMALFRKFIPVYGYFERAKARRGPYQVMDGITWDAIYCMRDVLRELPDFYATTGEALDARTFMDIIKSDYASRRDATLTPTKKRRISEFQRHYLALVERTAALLEIPSLSVLERLASRTARIDRYERITGDSIIGVTKKVIKNGLALRAATRHRLIREFVQQQVLRPAADRTRTDDASRREDLQRLLKSLAKTVSENSEGI